MAVFAGVGGVTFLVVLYLGLTVGTDGPTDAPASRPSTPPTATTVRVTESGFDPPSVTVPAGTAAEFTFLRTSDRTCGTGIAVPSLKIRKALPLNQPVAIALPARASGVVAFECGMKMLKGTVVVE
jgi:plastocyanin domain-containing protein